MAYVSRGWEMLNTIPVEAMFSSKDFQEDGSTSFFRRRALRGYDAETLTFFRFPRSSFLPKGFPAGLAECRTLIMITDRFEYRRTLRPWAALQRLSTRVVRRLPHRQRLVRHFGQRLLVDPSELTGFYLYYEQEYDDGIFRFLARRLPTFAWAIDLGANIGVYTTFIAQYCNRVDAFEPDKHLVSKL